MHYRIIPHVVLCAASLFLYTSCADLGGSGNQVNAEQGEETFTFGLPSTETYATPTASESFNDGKKVRTMTASGPEGAYVSAGGAIFPQEEGAVSMIRNWRVFHNTFDGTYQLRSGEWMHIHFFGKYEKVRPTVPMLRQIFGKWIIFKGDDMSRVRVVTGQFGFKVLIFNDGRLPADTYAPDDH